MSWAILKFSSDGYRLVVLGWYHGGSCPVAVTIGVTYFALMVDQIYFGSGEGMLAKFYMLMDGTGWSYLRGMLECIPGTELSTV